MSMLSAGLPLGAVCFYHVQAKESEALAEEADRIAKAIAAPRAALVAGWQKIASERDVDQERAAKAFIAKWITVEALETLLTDIKAECVSVERTLNEKTPLSLGLTKLECDSKKWTPNEIYAFLVRYCKLQGELLAVTSETETALRVQILARQGDFPKLTGGPPMEIPCAII